MDGLQIGRVAHYVLTPEDRDMINAVQYPGAEELHKGNPVSTGQHVAMMITALHGDDGKVNGQAILDGAHSYWVTSRSFSEDPHPGTWHWAERA